MSDIITDAQQKIVDECRDKLMEHFDACRIFVNRHDGARAETATYETGGGNFCAQMGQVVEWLSIQEQYQRNHAIRQDRKK